MSEPATRLAAMRQRAEAATPGPWRATGLPYDDIHDPCIETADGDYVAQTVYDMQSASLNHHVDEDTEFIAHAREDVPYLLAVVDALLAVAKHADQHMGSAAFDAMDAKFPDWRAWS
jgi:hypothetical protein